MTPRLYEEMMMKEWMLDPSHSSIDFKVRHMAISTVKGSFNTFSGMVTTENDVIKTVEATIEAASIDTNDEKRDGHLKSADFFDVENYPSLVFKSTNVESLGGGEYRVTGDMTMHGQTHPVTFDVEVGKPIKDPWGMTRSAANVTGKLNRTDWGLEWNQVLEAGGLLVGEEVKFDFDVQATVKQQETATA